ncbi:MAG: YidC/Oxa1 family membrane protein insertase [Ruminococcus sp.]|nr:YidC/Oxa1 family membrane protein insertase [Ruminococcus sp.]
MFNLFATPLGWIMKLCYKLVSNYALALLIFTLITRLILLPLNIKQQKSTARMSMLQPEMDKLKKKYSKNQEKLNEETMALYQKHGVNPMASCLPMLLSMLILFSMIPVIYGPLTYVSDLDKDKVTASNTMITNLATVSQGMKASDTTMAKLLEENGGDYDKVFEIITDDDKDGDNYKNYKDTRKIFDDKDSSCDEWQKLVEIFEKHPDIDEFITNDEYVSQTLSKTRPELTTFDFVDKDKADAQYADILDSKVRAFAEDFNYEIFGLSLGAIPSMKSKLALIPILSFLLQLLATVISMHYTKKNNPSQAGMNGSMKVMLFLMPLFSLWIAFSYPAGLGLYWIFSSFIGIFQTIFLNKVYSPAKVKAIVEKEMEEAKQRRKSGKKTFMERALEIQQEQNGRKPIKDDDDDEEEDEDKPEKKLSKAELKELQRKKLNEARKRMAEKYGDEYTEE